MFNPRPLEEFIGLVSANQPSKKEIRLSIESARRIADSISYLLLALTEQQDKSEQLTKNLKSNQVSEVELQGGKF
jgi:hypothetical protein